MGTGYYGGFGASQGQKTQGLLSLLSSGDEYNKAGSKDVKQVDSISKTDNVHTKPQKGSPNSVLQNYKNGKLDSERYYDSDGNPYLDIDYSDHGNPKMHPDVPHQHKITFDDDGMHREKYDGGIKK